MASTIPPGVYGEMTTTTPEPAFEETNATNDYRYFIFRAWENVYEGLLASFFLKRKVFLFKLQAIIDQRQGKIKKRAQNFIYLCFLFKGTLRTKLKTIPFWDKRTQNTSWIFITTQCLKTTQKVSSLQAKQISKKTFGYTLLPLINSFEFLQILGIYSMKRITKNQKEFSRGKNV